MRIVTLKHQLKAQASGKPKPLTVPDLREQLSDMNCQQGLGDVWEEASMDEVLVYLRGNRNLMLPDWDLERQLAEMDMSARPASAQKARDLGGTAGHADNNERTDSTVMTASPDQLLRLQAKLNQAKEGKVKAERSISRSDPPAPSSRRASPAPSTSAKRGPAAVTLYKDIDNREALTEMLIAANFQKGSFRSQVTKFVEREKNKENKITAGWYTEAAMSSVLKMNPSDIKDVVEYTKDKPELRRQGLGKSRKYKYNPKKLQHWVENDWTTTLKDTTRIVSRWENNEAGQELPKEVNDAMPAMPNIKSLGFENMDPSAVDADDDKAKRVSDEDTKFLDTVCMAFKHI
ncbi:unnamed protein product [Symbiodinium sp. CCMP2592]|nr:unnamed protein product [Symbiodinium sp. CCMP2592]